MTIVWSNLSWWWPPLRSMTRHLTSLSRGFKQDGAWATYPMMTSAGYDHTIPYLTIQWPYHTLPYHTMTIQVTYHRWVWPYHTLLYNRWVWPAWPRLRPPCPVEGWRRLPRGAWSPRTLSLYSLTGHYSTLSAMHLLFIQTPWDATGLSVVHYSLFLTSLGIYPHHTEHIWCN